MVTFAFFLGWLINANKGVICYELKNYVFYIIYTH